MTTYSEQQQPEGETLCISCKEPALKNCYSEAGIREVHISGMCEKCFDALFEDEEDSCQCECHFIDTLHCTDECRANCKNNEAKT